MGLTLCQSSWKEFQINIPSTSCVQLCDSTCTMWLRSAENKKQTRWLNSPWLIQMVSTPASCENVGETKRRGCVWHCSNYLGDCDSATSEKTKSRSRLWASAGICVKHSALQHVLEEKGATSFDLTFNIWTELKQNCQSVEREFSSVMQNSLYQFFVLTMLCIRRQGGAEASSSGLPKLCCLYA